ncbi:hypothetical protein HCA69_15070 [Listeria grandensis]|uniref:Bacterial Ig domain-containing protein n=1 Tax=Listeria grandensis TaxID=1494963 RepID=A0A7X1CR40_9LIST|nr:Ig-like domain-containing protein [Listeria grandensis]MBC1937689.1 hypothetical protein [Listeria grandensis]
MKLKTKVVTATLLAGTCMYIVGGTALGGSEAPVAKASTLTDNVKLGTVLDTYHYVYISSALREGQTKITGLSGIEFNYGGGASVAIKFNDQDWMHPVRANSAGDWTFENLRLHAGDRVKVRATFPDGKVAESESVVKPHLDAPVHTTVLREGVTVVSGTATPDMYVHIRDDTSNLSLSYEVKTSATGQWTLPLERPLQKGMVIMIEGYMRGEESDYVRVNGFLAVDEAVNPTITSTLNSGSTTVSGESAGGADVELWSGTTKIGTAKADNLGAWTATVSPLTAGATLKVKATLFGKVKESINYTVAGVVTEKPSELSTLTTNSTKVTGKGVAGATVIAKVAGTEIGRGTVDSNGKFEVTIPKQVAGTHVAITQTKNNVASEAVEIVVAKGLEKLTAISAVTTGSTKVTGKGHPGATVKVRVAGTEIGTGTVGANGEFEVTIKPQTVGTELVLNQTKDGDESDSVKVTVVAHIGAPSIAEFYVGTVYLHGTAPTGAVQVTLRIAGKDIRTANVAADGTYRIYANDVAALKIVGTAFEVIAHDANGNDSEVATSTVKGLLPAPVVAVYHAGQSYVTGTVSHDVTRISIYDKAGTLLRNGQVNADGTFRIYVGGVPALQIVGDTFSVKAFNEHGTSSVTVVTIQPK